MTLVATLSTVHIGVTTPCRGDMEMSLRTVPSVSYGSKLHVLSITLNFSENILVMRELHTSSVGLYLCCTKNHRLDMNI